MAEARQVIRAEGATELASALRSAQQATRRELAASNRAVARQARDWARTAAASGTPRQRRAASGITSSAGPRNAKLGVRPSAGAPEARATIWGAKRRTGWNRRNRDSRPQHPEWVGVSWAPAVRGQGPHVLNDTLAERMPEIEDLYLAGQWAAIDRALPRAITTGRPRGR